MPIVIVALLVVASSVFGSTYLRQQISTINSTTRPLFKVLADIDVVDADGRSALHHAVMLGNLDLVKLFLEYGANTRIKDDDGNLPLYYAEDLAYADVEAGRMDSPHFAIISWLLQHMGTITRDRKSWNALHWAVLSNDLKRVEQLLDAGMDATYGRHQNSLDLAFLLRNKEMFTLLLKGRIGQKKVDLYNNRLFVVMKTFRLGPSSSPDSMPTVDDLQTLISWIAEVNTSLPLPNLVPLYCEDAELAQLVKVALDLGFNVNSTGTNDAPLLVEAAFSGKVLTIQTLLEYGADTYVYFSGLKKNLVHLAAQEGHAEALEVLLDQTDIDIDSLDQPKYSALMRAARNGQYQAVRVLKERGADQTLRNYQGKTALDLAKIGLKGSLKRKIKDYQQTVALLEAS